MGNVSASFGGGNVWNKETVHHESGKISRVQNSIIGQFVLDLQENMDKPSSSQVDSLFPQSMNTVQIVFTQTGICGLAGLALIPVHFTTIYICITVWGVLFLVLQVQTTF